MKRCPRCNQRFTESWLTFCPSDGSTLLEVQDSDKQAEGEWSEQPSVNQLRRPGMGGWAAPQEHAPVAPWLPPPPPPLRPPNQTLAIASMITGIAGWVIGCFGPFPGIAALIMGLMALSRIKNSPEREGGKPFAIVGVVTGTASVVMFAAIILYLVLAVVSSK
ncbi:MAG: DUF4190 domain-containing protein [Pyrinomonadaceae bacterium]